jgi:hypothetical protein
METLFGPKLIKSISYDDQEIIGDIINLHCGGRRIDVDPTYSVGNFYKHGIPPPIHKFDINPQVNGVIKADARNLPLENSSMYTIMFDPPFVIGGATYKESQNGSCIIQKRFSQFTSFDELRDLYIPSLKEFHRILVDGGVVIFKCQDCIASSKQYWTHVDVCGWARDIGFYPKDLFILLTKNRLLDGRKQQHARKFHSYYWVFKKI